MTPEEQAVEAIAGQPAPVEPPAQDPAVATAPPVQPAAPASQGPWSADLEQSFTDPGIRQQVDGFLREKVQPYTTKLEQDLAPAKSLWEDFHSKPRETFLEVAEDIYGEDGAKALAEFLDNQANEGAPNAPYEQAVEQAPQAQPTVPPEVQEIIDERNEAKDREVFKQGFDAVNAAHPEIDLDFDLFVPHVAKTGDWESAVESYKAYEAAWAEKHGAAPAPTPAPTPPPVIGAGATSGPTTPPQAKQYGSVGDAIQDWADEIHAGGGSVIPASPAPPVPGA